MNNLKIQQDILKLLFSKPEEVIYHPLRDGSGTAVGTKYAFFGINVRIKEFENND